MPPYVGAFNFIEQLRELQRLLAVRFGLPLELVRSDFETYGARSVGRKR